MTGQHIYRAMDMHLHNQEVCDTPNPHFTLVIPLEAQPTCRLGYQPFGILFLRHSLSLSWP